MLRAPLMTVHEVADLLQMTEATVRSWIRHNELRAIKFGRDWRIARVDLENFLNEHANIAAPGAAETPPDEKPAQD